MQIDAILVVEETTTEVHVMETIRRTILAILMVDRVLAAMPLVLPVLTDRPLVAMLLARVVAKLTGCEMRQQPATVLAILLLTGHPDQVTEVARVDAVTMAEIPRVVLITATVEAMPERMTLRRVPVKGLRPTTEVRMTIVVAVVTMTKAVITSLGAVMDLEVTRVVTSSHRGTLRKPESPYRLQLCPLHRTVAARAGTHKAPVMPTGMRVTVPIMLAAVGDRTLSGWKADSGMRRSARSASATVNGIVTASCHHYRLHPWMTDTATTAIIMAVVVETTIVVAAAAAQEVEAQGQIVAATAMTGNMAGAVTMTLVPTSDAELEVARPFLLFLTLIKGIFFFYFIFTYPARVWVTASLYVSN